MATEQQRQVGDLTQTMAQKISLTTLHGADDYDSVRARNEKGRRHKARLGPADVRRGWHFDDGRQDSRVAMVQFIELFVRRFRMGYRPTETG